MGKLLVIGGAGQVGGSLVEAVGKERATATFWRTPVEDGIAFDLESAAENKSLAKALLDEHRPDAVVIAAGYTHVDGCEKDHRRAMRANRDGPASLARAASEAGAGLVYYSTEYVFDGADGPYPESAKTNPLSVYGRSKLEGERAVVDAAPDALILRTTVVFGPETQGKNFGYRLSKALSAGERINVPDDQRSSPTYNRDLAAVTVALLEAKASGVYHVAGPEVMGRAEFAARVARAAGLDPSLIDPIQTERLDQTADRPLNAGLVTERLCNMLPRARMKNVEDAVAHWLDHPRGKPWPT